MRYGSVCSGIEAATVAWEPLGWTPAWFAEISKFPSRVLAHHYPGVANVGDFTQPHPEYSNAKVDLLVGGTPCQSFSVAGLRGGLQDGRGNLALEFLRLADRLQPRWVVWENVPGVLSSGRGRDFGSILGALGELGYGYAYRVLNAQYFGVPQRRRRVFLVGHLGSRERAAQVLFDPEGRSGNPTPVREPGGALAGGLAGGPRGGDPLAFHPAQDPISGPVSPALSTTVPGMGVMHALTCHSVKGGDPTTDPYCITDQRVRRLMPLEAERLQGFPDGYTDIPGAKDAPRYHALGNSMAIPVVRHIGRRIAAADSVPLV